MSEACPHCGQQMPDPDKIVEWAGFEINETTGVLRVLATLERYQLTTQQSRLTAALLKVRGRILSKEQIMDMVYKEKHVDEQPGEKIIEVYICYLRKRIPQMREQLENVWGRGYRIAPP